jgi:hypothetical protein
VTAKLARACRQEEKPKGDADGKEQMSEGSRLMQRRLAAGEAAPERAGRGSGGGDGA